MNECKNIRLYKADKPRLRSRTQNICFLISISAFNLKLMVKITSIFYRFLRIAWPDIFSPSDHFPMLIHGHMFFFYVMTAWLWVMFDVDVAHLGLLWIIVGGFGCQYNYVCSVSITPQGSKLRYICFKISHLIVLVLSKIGGTQRLFSVKYLFGEANVA